MECAKYYSHNIVKDNAITENEKPVQVREYLDKKNYFSEDESNIIRYYYKYISNIASQSKIALQEQADFSRVISVNTMLYALNRLEKFIYIIDMYDNFLQKYCILSLNSVYYLLRCA